MTWREAQLSLQLEVEQRIGRRIRAERSQEDIDFEAATAALEASR